MRDARRIDAFMAEGDDRAAMDAFAGDDWPMPARRASRTRSPRPAPPPPGTAPNSPPASPGFGAAEVWHEFVSPRQRLRSAFTRFIARPESRAQVVRRLQGYAFNRDREPALDAMPALAAETEATQTHLLAARRALPRDFGRRGAGGRRAGGAGRRRPARGHDTPHPASRLGLRGPRRRAALHGGLVRRLLRRAGSAGGAPPGLAATPEEPRERKAPPPS